MSLQNLIPILQVAIGPVIVVSGVGLLLLSMTNRFGRVIDRARLLIREFRGSVDTHGNIAAQLWILMRRARIIRAAITWAAVSALLAALLIIDLFACAALQVNLVWSLSGLFVSCLGCLIVSLILFILDINLSLKALKLEVGSITSALDSQRANPLRRQEKSDSVA